MVVRCMRLLFIVCFMLGNTACNGIEMFPALWQEEKIDSYKPREHYNIDLSACIEATNITAINDFYSRFITRTLVNEQRARIAQDVKPSKLYGSKHTIVDAIVDAYSKARVDSGYVIVDLSGYRSVDFGNLVISNDKNHFKILQRKNYSSLVVLSIINRGINISYLDSRNKWIHRVIERYDLINAKIIFNLNQYYNRDVLPSVYGNIYLSDHVTISILARNYRRDKSNWPKVSGYMLNLFPLVSFNSDNVRIGWKIEYMDLMGSTTGNVTMQGGTIMALNNVDTNYSNLHMQDTSVICKYSDV